MILSILSSCGTKRSQESSCCTKKEVVPNEIKVEAESYTSSSDSTEIKSIDSKAKYVSVPFEGWIAIDVNIAVAGRYKLEIRVSTDSEKEVICWIEDYYDNKENRTYNITGDILVKPSPSFDIYCKDGSPLNLGVHKMKLHYDQAVKIDWIQFTLIKEHNTTPLILIQNTDGTEWKEIWSDEFDGSTLDLSKWTYDIGDWGWGNHELQYYTDNRIKNTRLEDGHLIIEARKEDDVWTSSRITTRGKVSFLYGKIEFRAKLPSYKGNWAAGYTLCDDYIDELSWPYCGEIDILESAGYEMNDETGNGIAHASAHNSAYCFKLGNQPNATVEVKNMNHQFHTYAVEWTPEGIKNYVDDKLYFTYNDTSSESSWPFYKPQNIILNLAMGGGWCGYDGTDSVSSQKMVIDYVKVFELQ